MCSSDLVATRRLADRDVLAKYLGQTLYVMIDSEAKYSINIFICLYADVKWHNKLTSARRLMRSAASGNGIKPPASISVCCQTWWRAM